MQKQPQPRPWADLLMGVIHFEEGDLDAALACLLKAEQADPRLPDLHLRIGDTYLRRGTSKMLTEHSSAPLRSMATARRHIWAWA